LHTILNANAIVTPGAGDCSRPPPDATAGNPRNVPIEVEKKERNMDPVGLIIWLVIGGIIGWLASLIMKTDAQQGIILNVVVGIIGALIGGWLIAPLIGGSGIMGYVSALIGAVILLAIVNLFRRGRVR
jgi:uncharacterized membrane protein YeaQ/YmgE (transglycosylase-associated protein family)